jgi:transcription elongation factor GreA
MQKVPMTIAGAEKLKAELAHLKSIERPQVIQAIAEARAHGDLKENAEYHAAKEKQSFIEGRIQELEAKLSHAQIIDITKLPHEGKVVFGATMTLCNLESDKTVSYQIVGDDEADVKAKKLSYNAPIARAAIGKMEGDVIKVQTPGGEVEYEIIEVKYS